MNNFTKFHVTQKEKEVEKKKIDFKIRFLFFNWWQ